MKEEQQGEEEKLNFVSEKKDTKYDGNIFRVYLLIKFHEN
jgi:hypothetical protein